MLGSTFMLKDEWRPLTIWAALNFQPDRVSNRLNFPFIHADMIWQFSPRIVFWAVGDQIFVTDYFWRIAMTLYTVIFLFFIVIACQI